MCLQPKSVLIKARFHLKGAVCVWLEEMQLGSEDLQSKMVIDGSNSDIEHETNRRKRMFLRVFFFLVPLAGQLGDLVNS